jgi:hypothetical protein
MENVRSGEEFSTVTRFYNREIQLNQVSWRYYLETQAHQRLAASLEIFLKIGQLT